MIERVGLGYDLHRLEIGRPLRLAGVDLEADRGPVGHSDADVVLHAVIDAVLGATGRGDIGDWFPDSQPEYAGIDSRRLLERVLGEIRSGGYELVNVDVTIQLERPKLSAWKPRLRARLAELLDLPTQAVNIKAKTQEGLDSVGAGQAVACWAVAGLTGPKANPAPEG
ncbi:MAG: 2-C-methyl-D-erythritol 2,4-cyclodiphosphate synthase [Sedimentisphaerales bacterium]|nr:2-C-methyl-D-erythritol 2,4-cyclodiphosphate synthase [Sedimentisphaerales bacterium]